MSGGSSEIFELEVRQLAPAEADVEDVIAGPSRRAAPTGSPEGSPVSITAGASTPATSLVGYMSAKHSAKGMRQGQLYRLGSRSRIDDSRLSSDSPHGAITAGENISVGIAGDVFRQFTDSPHEKMTEWEFKKVMTSLFGDVSDEDIALSWDEMIRRKRPHPGDGLLDKELFEEEMVGSGLLQASEEVAPVTGSGRRNEQDSPGNLDPLEIAAEEVQRALDNCNLCIPCSWFIHPDRGWRVYWDMYLLVLIIYVAICVPLRIGFDLEVVPWNTWFIIDAFADVSFLLDLVFNFRTGYTDIYGVMHSEGCEITKNYLGWPEDARCCCFEENLLEKLLRRAEAQKVDVNSNMTEQEILTKMQDKESSKCLKECLMSCGGVKSKVCIATISFAVNVAAAPFRGWFTVDLLSCLPISYVQLAVTSTNGEGSDGPGSRNVRMVRILRLLRLAKLLRLARLGRWLGKYAEDLREFYAGISIIKAVFTTISMAHMVACAWHYLAHDPDAYPTHQGSVLCKAARDPIEFPCDDVAFNSWLDLTGIDQSVHPSDNLADRYVTALYWATTTLSTVGYGDITPQTKTERLFTVLTQLLGTCTFAYTAGTLSSVIMESKLDPKVQEYNEKMPRITEYLRVKRVPRWKRIEVREHFDRVFHAHKAVDERSVLDLMPGGVKGTMARDIINIVHKERRRLIEKTQLFRGLGEMAVVDLITKMEPDQFCGPCEDYPTGQQIVKQGELGTDIYIIRSGFCCCTHDDMGKRDVEKVFGMGLIFGEKSTMEEGGGDDGRNSTRTVVANGKHPHLGLSYNEGSGLVTGTGVEEPGMDPSVTKMFCLSSISLREFFDSYPHLEHKLKTRVRLQNNSEAEKRRREQMKRIFPALTPQLFSQHQARKAANPAGYEITFPMEENFTDKSGVTRPLEELFQQSSHGNGGTVSIATVVEILYPHRAWLISPTLLEADYEAHVRRIFDTDHDGSVDRMEFFEGILRLKQSDNFARRKPTVTIDRKVDDMKENLSKVETEIQTMVQRLESLLVGIQHTKKAAGSDENESEQVM